VAAGYKETRSDAGAAPEIAALRECYRRGPLSPGPDGPPERKLQGVRTQWRARVMGRLLERTSPADGWLVSQGGRFSALGRKAASDSRVAEACRYLAVAGQLVERQRGASEEARLICFTERSAAEAYLDCSCGDFDQAQARLLDSYRAAAALDHSFGYNPMRSHQIHILNNAVRVDGLAGNYVRAIELARGVFRYLDGEVLSRLDEDGIWRPPTCAADFDSQTWLFLTCQAIHEVALVLAMMSYQSCRISAVPLLEDIGRRSARIGWPGPLRTWGRLKRSYLAGDDTEEFLAESHRFMSGAEGGWSPLLWFMVSLDAATVCERIPGGDGFRREVLAGAGSACLPNSVPKSRLQE